MSRKSSSSGLGVIVILIGIAILLLNFNILSLDMFWGISKLWPLIFIVIGLSMLLKSVKYMGTILWLLFFGVVIAYSFLNINDKTWMVGENVVHEQFQENFADFQVGQLDMSIKTGSINVKGLEGSTLNYSIPTEYTNPVTTSNTSGELKLYFEESKKDGLFFSKNKMYDVNLPTSGHWSLDIESGVGEANLDLQNLKIRNLNLEVGVGACHVFFGEDTQGDCQIEVGVGEVTLTIPENIGVKVYVDKGLGSVDVPESYKKEGGNYTSSNYETAEYILEIHVDVGVGSLKIK